jgi:hypothetical protein
MTNQWKELSKIINIGNMDSEEIRRMSIENARMAVNQSKRIEEMENYNIDNKLNESIQTMIRWYRFIELESNGKVKWHLIGYLSIPVDSESIVQYMKNILKKGIYGEVDRMLLNWMRELYLLNKDIDTIDSQWKWKLTTDVQYQNHIKKYGFG